MRSRFLAAIACVLSCSLPGWSDDRPNIVLVFADDMGWRDIGYKAVDDFIETPCLDRLATEGVTFTSAYASAANCAPSRACLLSGQYTPRHGLYAVGNTERGPKKQMRLRPTPNTHGLIPEAVTLAETLKAAGYATGCVGKWHLSGKDGADPTEQGFDFAYDSFGEGPIPPAKGGNRKGPPSDPKGVFDLTEKACGFIRDHQDEPFFCYLSHHAVHGPLQGRPATLAKFKDKGDSSACSAMYAACTYDLDASVGRVLACLDGLNLAENTLLIFTSDNGATNSSDQEPLRGRKGSYYEGGIRVPMIVRWPGVTPVAKTCDTPVSNVDFYKTFAAVADAEPPARHPIDGRDLQPLFANLNTPIDEAIYWHFPGYLNDPVPRGRKIDIEAGFRSRPVTVMRKGSWKLHLFEEEWVLDGGWKTRATSGAVELYDLDNDLGERIDLVGDRPELRDQLLQEMLKWRAEVGARPPTKPNPKYRPKRPDTDR